MGMGSLLLMDGSASVHLGQPMACWHRHSWDYTYQQRACTQALPVLSLWAKLEPKRCEGPAWTTFPHSLGDEGCKC